MTDLVERYRRWLQNIGFDGGPESPPIQALEHIERQAALLREAREALSCFIEGRGDGTEGPYWSITHLTHVALPRARTTLAKLENADGVDHNR